MTAAAVAGEISADERATTLPLETLEALGYVGKQDSRYDNTDMTLKWMSASSPTNVIGLFIHFEQIIELWGYLEESVRQGKPPMLIWERS